jgi:hypothetical protein
MALELQIIMSATSPISTDKQVRRRQPDSEGLRILDELAFRTFLTIEAQVLWVRHLSWLNDDDLDRERLTVDLLEHVGRLESGRQERAHLENMA